MYNVGDLVYVPNAYEWVWKSCMTVIKKIIKKDDGTYKYYADCPHNNLFNNEPPEKVERCFEEHEIFTSKEECDKYISNYYYGGLCRGCHYDDIVGTIWRCRDCSHIEKIKGEKPTDNTKCVCKLNGITVDNQHHSVSHECCRYYSPTLPQNKEAYVSWDHYDDILKNCEFNPECIHHKNSCHKTCTYEHYMKQLVSFPISFEFEGRKVKFAKIARRMWIDQTFLSDGILQCICLELEPELTKTGRRKKGSIDYRSFDDYVKIDIQTGKIITD